MSEQKWTKGPWEFCGSKRGGCSCGSIWSVTADHPVAEVVSGKWGDDYPAMRESQDSCDISQKFELYMAQITYGEINAETAKANAFLIAKAPELYAALQREVSNCPTCGGEEALSEICPRCKESRELLESIK